MAIRDNQEVFHWFKTLSGAKRVEMMCGLIHLCIPLEIRYFHTVIEAIKMTDKQVLDDIVRRSNNVEEYKQYFNHTVFNKFPIPPVTGPVSSTAAATATVVHLGHIPLIPANTTGQPPLNHTPNTPQQALLSPNVTAVVAGGGGHGDPIMTPPVIIPPAHVVPIATMPQACDPSKLKQQRMQSDQPLTTCSVIAQHGNNSSVVYSPNSPAVNSTNMNNATPADSASVTSSSSSNPNLSRKNSTNLYNLGSEPSQKTGSENEITVNGLLPHGMSYNSSNIEEDRESVSSAIQSPRSSQSSSQSNLTQTVGSTSKGTTPESATAHGVGRQGRQRGQQGSMLNRMISQIQRTIDSNNSGGPGMRGQGEQTPNRDTPRDQRNSSRKNMFKPEPEDQPSHNAGQPELYLNHDEQIGRSTSTTSIVSNETSSTTNHTTHNDFSPGHMQQQQAAPYQGRLSTNSIPPTPTGDNSMSAVTPQSAKNVSPTPTGGVLSPGYIHPVADPSMMGNPQAHVMYQGGQTLENLNPLTVTIPPVSSDAGTSPYYPPIYHPPTAATPQPGNLVAVPPVPLVIHPATDINLSVRSRLIVSLALLAWDNRDCSIEIFNILSRQLTIPFVTTLLAQGELWDYSESDYSEYGGRILTSKLYSEMNLMLAMAIYHPAFTYEQQTILHAIMNELIKWMDIVVMDQVKSGVRMNISDYPLPPSFWYGHNPNMHVQPAVQQQQPPQHGIHPSQHPTPSNSFGMITVPVAGQPVVAPIQQQHPVQPVSPPTSHLHSPAAIPTPAHHNNPPTSHNHHRVRSHAGS